MLSYLSAPFAVQVHLPFAALALIIAIVQIWMLRPGSKNHKLFGRIWVFLMIGVNISSLFIASHIPIRIGMYGPIHILTFVSLISTCFGVYAAKQHKIRTHKNCMLGAAMGLMGAGLFALAPGRLILRILGISP